MTGWKLVVIFYMVQNFLANFVDSQDPFIRSCGALPGVDGNAYCAAACGATSTATCTGDGLCQCSYACGVAAPNPLFTAGLCPPPAQNPPDVPEARQACVDSCPLVCAGGIGEICSSPGPVAQNPDMFLAICTCYCPPPACPTTTPAPGIALIPNILPAIKIFKVKKGLTALSLFAFLIPLFLKLVGLTLLKLIAAACYWYFKGEEDMMSLGWDRSG
ncbi:uncharacterized protein LOC118438883 [Folsomia candida]|uniref:Uncharacterized protein n=1 Tax=Folsomia candida TaxID=158441 RepID=A0A226F2N3_FOLCA|nr:uncharacterized protein LOC118438883 [Folsomia candida]OXA64049.1 hypothetical protein Fcan01_00901 [Folsomia candida]